MDSEFARCEERLVETVVSKCVGILPKSIAVPVGRFRSGLDIAADGAGGNGGAGGPLAAAVSIGGAAAFFVGVDLRRRRIIHSEFHPYSYILESFGLGTNFP